MPQSISYTMQLFCMRILEVLIALAYVALMTYCGTHPGWWMYLQSPLVTAATITTFLTIPNFLSIRILLVNYASAFAINGVRTTTDLVLVGLWSTTFICMALPKGRDLEYASNTPPYGPWIAAMILCAVECICFSYSTILVIRDKYEEGVTQLSIWVW